LLCIGDDFTALYLFVIEVMMVGHFVEVLLLLLLFMLFVLLFMLFVLLLLIFMLLLLLVRFYALVVTTLLSCRLLYCYLYLSLLLSQKLSYYYSATIISSI